MITVANVERCIELLMRTIFVPALNQLEEETGQRLNVGVCCLVDRQIVARSVYGPQELHDSASGEVRCVLTESRQGLFNFSCQAIIKGLQLGTGYSGFSLQGKLDFTEPAGNVRIRGRANHYNVWDWKKTYEVRSA